MVSVVIPSYNCAAYVGDAIRSCLGQSRRDGWELIVVDDGSTDDTARVLAAFSADRRVKILRQDNAGSAVARNLGIAHAAGEYIAFLDADDLYHPQAIERFQAAIPRLPAAVGFAYCDYARVDAGGGSPQTVIVRGPLERPRLLWQYLLPRWFPVLTSTTLVRRQTLVSAGLFDPTFTVIQDLELWTRVIPSWNAAKIDGCATYRRMRPGQATENKSLIMAFRERCNRQFLAALPFSAFSGTDDPGANGRLAEQFGDAFLQAERPLPRSAAASYRIARSFAPTAAIEAKITALADVGAGE
jgi:glycosyltransferase involved in cell wall biosynthesis